jgi:hypothetical protein
MKSIIKNLTMWLHNRGVLGMGATTWLFAAFDLRSA